MNRRKRLFLILLAAAGMLSLTGCWDYRDIENMSVAMGMAIDKTPDGYYLLTTEVAKPEGEEGVGSFRIEAAGRTIAECMQNTGKKLENEVYWANTQVLVVSEAVAKEGLAPIVDIAERHRELRPTLQLIVSKEATARELFETKGLSTDIISLELASVLKNSERDLSRASIPALYRVVNDMSSTGKDVTLPAIKIVRNEKDETAELDGTAVFSDNRLAGFLSGVESEALLFVQNEVKGGLLVVKDTDGGAPEPYVTLEITKSATGVKPAIEDGQLTLNVSIETEAVVTENDAANFAADAYDRLERRAQAKIEQSVLSLVKRVQRDFGADIFGFGKIVQDRLPEYWEQHGGGWREGFRDIAVRVTCKVGILGDGLLKEPVGGGA